MLLTQAKLIKQFFFVDTHSASGVMDNVGEIKS